MKNKMNVHLVTGLLMPGSIAARQKLKTRVVSATREFFLPRTKFTRLQL